MKIHKEKKVLESNATEFHKIEQSGQKNQYENIIGKLNFHVPEFVNRFEREDSRVRVDLILYLPPELSKFMEICERLAKSLRKKKKKYSNVI